MVRPYLRLFLLCHVLPLLWLPMTGRAGEERERATVAERGVRSFVPADLTVPEGWVVELAAGPPLVAHPTMACFDDRGRLYVCHSAGLNLSAEQLEQQLPNSIVRLEDTDQDGRFDRATTFADKMTFPMGAAWFDGALYVASPPNIWRLRDTNDDGKADERKVLVSQFGYTGNAASIHGCFLGPDGRLYWCDGYHGHEFRDQEGTVTSKRAASYIFSCQVDGSDVRIHCGGGMDNPVEVDFMPSGEMLGTVNILYSRPRDDCLVHWLYGGAYPHREKALSELKVTGDVLGPAHRFGHVAVSGMLRYRNSARTPAWRDNVFATFFNSGKVVRVEMQRQASTFTGTQREFLTAKGHDFHPTDVVEDADGSLLIVDTGGWFYRGCPTSQYAKPDVLGAIYRVRSTSHPAAEDPRGLGIPWRQLAPDQILSLLVDDRPAVADRAVAEAARRGGTMLPLLRQVMDAGRGRVGTDTRSPADGNLAKQSLWVLTRMRSRSGNDKRLADELVRQALRDPRPDVRIVACRSLATYSDPQALDRLAEKLDDDHPAVRRLAAVGLGRLKDARAVPFLLEALRCPADRSEEHALIFALIEINTREPIAKGLADTRAGVRRATLIALDQMDSGVLTGHQVVPLLDDPDPGLRATALWAVRRHPQWAADTVPLLHRWMVDSDRWRQRRSEAAGLMTLYLAEPKVETLIGELLQREKEPGLTTLVLQSVARGHAVPLHPSWTQPIKGLLLGADADLLQSAIAATNAINSKAFDQTLQRIGNDERQPSLLRFAALEAVAKKRGAVDDAQFNLLLTMLEQPDAVTEVDFAAQTLGAANLKPAQLIKLISVLEETGPMQLSQLIRPFERCRDVEVGRRFLAAMGHARSFHNLAINEFSDVVKRYPPDLLPPANQLLDQLKQRDQDKLQRLDRLVAALDRGNAERGKKLFLTEKAKCSTCHRVGQEGGNIGPDLTTIGANRSRRDLLESIVFPSSTLVRQYEPFTVYTVQGRVLTGLVARETENDIYLQQQSGDPLRIPRSDIDEIVSSTVSLMPNGLEEALSESELIDVVAFLATARPDPRAVSQSTPEAPGRINAAKR